MPKLISSTSEDERTTAVGLFNFAVSYWKSAEVLQVCSLKGVTHPEAPIQFLYVHAIELFLKSRLRLNLSVNDLKDIGHGFSKLKTLCDDVICFQDETTKITLDLVAKHDMNIKSRYIKSGYYNSYPSLDALKHACENLEKAVRPLVYTES